ncbi:MULTISPECIES: Maf family protein [Cryobacterium]|jgi:septum formation protein|uniref:Nucleoside triphosphate pyrophosphatase n=1 Tax=Cryobacterium lyxosi TaxID=1259228 RepID=A0A4R8ZLI0_9MICO|nr:MULTISPECIES: nucleoside triphosphate pyrophosphatase [Cryobacterium]TFD29236.1 septum formation protein Maf [Cryobacterium lyxosi]
MRLYLASTSPARLALLRAAGIEPVLINPDVDEARVVAETEAAVGSALEPRVLVELLARAKAEAAVSASLPKPLTGLLLGGDSVFVLDGVIYGKPHTAEAARERWERQRGRTGTLYSGHWLIEVADGVPGRAIGAAVAAEVTFADDLDDAELDAYVATGEPLFVAGAFTIDSLGAPFITSIVGDPSTVVGLSLPTLRRLVRTLGHEWPTLWNRPGAL